ncbi:hypothetical protein BV898_01018 [Hypsibius exemplaris]|uniref:Uncharacterized protein n=1 Tax=Hypsibius exemplaris TaxID=2072580 RepID=A0A1W0XCY5_HYPEX|nr:hypothetical protein BV898_01018 [Hypsibius exemplaris]
MKKLEAQLGFSSNFAACHRPFPRGVPPHFGRRSRPHIQLGAIATVVHATDTVAKVRSTAAEAGRRATWDGRVNDGLPDEVCTVLRGGRPLSLVLTKNPFRLMLGYYP